MAAPTCKTCKWVEGEGEFSQCRAPENFASDVAAALVPYPPRADFKYCSTHRAYSLSGMCGVAGGWWTPGVIVAAPFRPTHWHRLVGWAAGGALVGFIAFVAMAILK